jgi:hypothetical protein
MIPLYSHPKANPKSTLYAVVGAGFIYPIESADSQATKRSKTENPHGIKEQKRKMKDKGKWVGGRVSTFRLAPGR